MRRSCISLVDFFFFKPKTAYGMRISDWSSDVCSSDLEKRELQRRTVIEAAAKLFSQKGYAGTSMLDVARTLEISRPALYHYFVSKEDVLTTLVKDVTIYLENVGDSLTADGSRDPAETLHEMTRKNALFILNNTVMFRRSEEHTSELQSLMRSSYAVFCFKKKK